MSKHTPGPWCVDESDIWQTRLYVLASECAKDDAPIVANLQLKSVCGPSDIEQQANALLIAAAPELLEALRNMVDWLDDGNRVLSDACTADVKAARAAIAKATGEAA